jgi:Ca2+-binding EF-hand superfamily protein
LRYEGGLVSKNLLKNYIASVIGECFAEWFIKFFLIRSYINLKEFESLGEKFKSMTLRETHLVSFFLYDQNGDNFVCPRDVFTVF